MALRDRFPLGETLSPAARRLLAAARPVRLMKPFERARAAAFVRALADEPRRGWLAAYLEYVPRVAFAFTIMAFVFGTATPGDMSDAGSSITPEDAAADPALEEALLAPRYGFAWVPDEPSTRGPDGEEGDTPGYGDVCGRHVCEFEPSCCEGAWDERCDRKLLEITRLTYHFSSMRAGRCYWHDREACPGCSCPLYLKREEVLTRADEPGVSLGYDGGSGCLGDIRPLLSNLKWMCVEGFCEE